MVVMHGATIIAAVMTVLVVLRNEVGSASILKNKNTFIQAFVTSDGFVSQSALACGLLSSFTIL
jgi:hypothetical protein